MSNDRPWNGFFGGGKKEPAVDEQGQTTEPETIETDADVAEQALETDFLGLSEQIQRLTSERDQFQQQVLRTMADFQNFRKRKEAETSQMRMFATESLIRDLLPVLDNFERTLAHAEAGASTESVLEGIRAVSRQLRQALETQNVKRIVSVGEAFDPETHEALGTVETDEMDPDTVHSEIEPGYRMGDRVIRPARVRVAKKP